MFSFSFKIKLSELGRERGQGLSIKILIKEKIIGKVTPKKKTTLNHKIKKKIKLKRTLP